MQSIKFGVRKKKRISYVYRILAGRCLHAKNNYDHIHKIDVNGRDALRIVLPPRLKLNH